jgi:23S rRNA pseudouridine1911/1915/1917 synthase
MFDHLKRQFQARKVQKKYTALVLGVIGEDEGEIKFKIGRSRANPIKRRVFRGVSGGSSVRDAYTYWRVMKRYAYATLVEVQPTTGRMHQIRVHMTAIGHPVAGDRIYTRKNAGEVKHLGRLFLHASYLSFIGLKGEKFTFTAPLPDDLTAVLKNLPFMVR